MVYSRGLVFFFVMISLPITFCAKLHDERSWNNPVDPSGTNYFPPEITSSSQTVINVFPVKTFDFNITATDNEKSITGYFWSLDNGISWKSTGVVPTFSTSWDSTSSGPRKILVYVVDNHNLRSKIDTINIFVHNYKSILPTINDTEVSQSDTFKQKLTVTDSTNYLKYYWDTNLNGWDDSLVATEAMCIASKPEGGTVYVHWTVINGSNYVTNDTFMVYFNKRPFPPVIVSPVKDTIKKFISYDYIHNCGSVLIECTASDPDDKDSALTFTLRYGPKAGVFTDSVVTQNRKIKLSNIKELTMYPFELTVNDHCFNRTTIKGQFIVLPPPPKPEGMKFITCQNSTFSMGLDGKDSTAMPVHQVTLSNDFWIDTTEITTEKFAKILSLTQPQATSARLPVTNITWFDAVLFCNARSKYHHLDTVYKYSTLTGTPGSQCKLENVITDLKVAGYRLPTEAEWEFACRGGTKTLFYWGNDRGISSEYAWTVTPADSKIHEVATLKPNNFELYDMAGNVWEWCNDWYGLYQKSPALDPAGALSGNERVVRGSSSASSSYFTQSGIRSKLRPEAYNAFTGFRTVLPAIP